MVAPLFTPLVDSRNYDCPRKQPGRQSARRAYAAKALAVALRWSTRAGLRVGLQQRAQQVCWAAAGWKVVIHRSTHTFFLDFDLEEERLGAD